MSDLREAYNNVSKDVILLESVVDYLEEDTAPTAGYIRCLEIELQEAERDLQTLRSKMLARLKEKPTK